MRSAVAVLFLAALSVAAPGAEIVTLPHEGSGEITWDNAEKQYFSEIWNTPVVTNVSVPRLQVFRPDPEAATGTAVIIAPGGGHYALSIESEGNQVAQWLTQKGITAFVLRYRLVPTGADGVQEFSNLGDRVVETVQPLLPLAIADGLSAVAYVREHAERFSLDTAKIGFMGFSAGGNVTLGVALNASAASRPDFIVPVYPWLTVFGDYEVPANAPPLLVVCASDDALGLATESVNLYSAWHAAGISAGLHMYSQGNHGFGMRRNRLPSDNWIERFYEWALAEDLTTPAARAPADSIEQ